MAFTRRNLIRGGLTVTALGAAGAAAGHYSASADQHIQQPSIAGTADWGARPPNGTIDILDYPPIYVVVHHTAGPNSDDFSQEYAFSVARGIQNYHMDHNGWKDSGQQFTNSRGGWLMEGRHESLRILNGGTQHVMGAHVANNNSTCIGIENDGTYVDVDVTPQLWDSLVTLVAYMCSQYGVPTSQILGHRDFNATQCPGDVLYARLPELRDAVAARLGIPVINPPAWPLLSPGDHGANVLAAQHLLRGAGANVPTDGVYGARTEAAVRRLADTHRVAYEPCYASRHADERGLLGVTLWPLLVKPTSGAAVHQGSDEVARAARVLLDARDQRLSTSAVIDGPRWQRLLSS